MSRYEPVQDRHSGAWYAARELQMNFWAPECECSSKEAAEEVCRRLNSEHRTQRAELKQDQQLRGVRF